MLFAFFYMVDTALYSDFLEVTLNLFLYFSVHLLVVRINEIKNMLKGYDTVTGMNETKQRRIR